MDKLLVGNTILRQPAIIVTVLDGHGIDVDAGFFHNMKTNISVVSTPSAFEFVVARQVMDMVPLRLIENGKRDRTRATKAVYIDPKLLQPRRMALRLMLLPIKSVVMGPYRSRRMA